jgi:hypothetical protein
MVPGWKKLAYRSQIPLTENYFMESSFDYTIHEYAFAQASERTIKGALHGQYVQNTLLFVNSLGLFSQQGEQRARWEESFFRQADFVNFRIRDSAVYLTVMRNRPTVEKYNAETGSHETIAHGHIYREVASGLIIREFLGDGVRYSYLEYETDALSELIAFTGQWKLPYGSGAYLTQGGSGYSSPNTCDGSTCNSSFSHNTQLLQFALDFQQQTAQGTGHVLAVEDGTVAAVASNVTCNSLDNAGCADFVQGCSDNGGAGNYVIVAHPDGSYSHYADLAPNSIRVSVGQNVCRGLYVANQGHTGKTAGLYNGCGDHIHFQRQPQVGAGSSKWFNSIPTDFTELPCGLSCSTVYQSQNSEVSSCACSTTVGQGTSEAELTTFQSAFNRAGGGVLGCPTAAVAFNGFTSFRGTVGHYQTFQNGDIEYHTNGQFAGQAFPLVNPLSSKWASFGFTSNHPLGYPTSDVSGQSTSCYGTNLRYQSFEGGALEHHLSGPRSGQVYEVHGAIYAKWGQKGYAGCPLGLPISDERNATTSPQGSTGRVSDFEGGHIHWRTGAAQAYESHGAIDARYVQMGGSGSWLGFPISDEYIAPTGFARSDFQGGYTTTTDGVNYTAFPYGCTYSFGIDGESFGSGPALASVLVIAPSGCPWTANSNAAWITITSGSGNGNWWVDYSVAANSSAGSRTGTMTIPGDTFTVNQAGTAVIGDFNGNGVPDLILQNDATRQIGVWYMGGRRVTLCNRRYG